MEEAAIGGHPTARYNLGCEEVTTINGRYERAMKHFIIAANLGCDESMKRLRIGYAKGLLSKEDFAAALRAHQVAVDAMESPNRKVSQEVSEAYDHYLQKELVV